MEMARQYDPRKPDTDMWFDDAVGAEVGHHERVRIAATCQAAHDVLKNKAQDREDLERLRGHVGSRKDDLTRTVTDAIDIFQWLDTLALGLQAEYFRRLKLVCLSALVFLVAYELFAHFPAVGFHGNPLVLAAGLVVLLYGFFELYGRKAREVQTAYLSIRSAAELVRVLVFWRMNGLAHSVAELIPLRHRDRMRMVYRLVGFIERCVESRPPGGDDAAFVREATLAHWHRDQLAYFARAAERNHCMAALWDALGFRLFVFGIFQVLALVALRVAGVEFEDVLVELLLTLAPVAIICAAVSEFYAERRGFEAAAKRFEHADASFFGHTARVRSAHGAQVDLREKLATTLFWAAGLGLVVVVGLRLAAGEVHHGLSGPVLVAAAMTYAAAVAMVAVVFLPRKAMSDDHARRDQEELVASLGTVDEPEWCSHLTMVGDSTALECVDWYVASEDRVITLPKG